MRIACLIFGVLFLISAGLQWNDPDPWGWIALWFAAAVVSLWAWRRDVPRLVPFAVAAAAIVWGIALAPAAFEDFRISDLAREMKAENPAIELSREFLGLAIIAGWSIAVGLTRGAPRDPRTGP